MSADDLASLMYAEGRSKWTELKVDFDAFAQYFEKALGSGGDREILAHAADFYLCCACALGEPRAAAILVRESLRIVTSAIVRVNSDPEFVKDTLQDLWDKLLRGRAIRLERYAARGPLNAWLRVSASRLAVDRLHHARQDLKRRAELHEAILAQGSGPESKLTRSRFSASFQGALARAFEDLSPRDRNVLRLRVHGQFNIDEIGRAYGVHRATAARWIERAKTRIFDFVHAELTRERVDLTRSEFNEIARVIGTEIDFTLPQHDSDAELKDSHQEP